MLGVVLSWCKERYTHWTKKNNRPLKTFYFRLSLQVKSGRVPRKTKVLVPPVGANQSPIARKAGYGKSLSLVSSPFRPMRPISFLF